MISAFDDQKRICLSGYLHGHAFPKKFTYLLD